MKDIRENHPWTTDQVRNTKPNVAKTETILSGYIGNSMNGGHNKTIAWKQVMAGEKIKEYRLNASIKMLTPKTPSYQNLYMTIRTYFVPNSRVWTNAEKYTAQKGGSAEIKIKEIPNMGGKIIPTIQTDDQSQKILVCHTTAWRDCFASSYIPRIHLFGYYDQGEQINGTLPKASILPLRGRIAIYNDFERNKEFDEEKQEYKGDTVSDAEWKSYIPQIFEPSSPGNYAGNYDYFTMRAKANNSYYTDFRTELQGFEEAYPPSEMSADTALMNWAQWEMKIAEARSQAENAQANDWDIIAKIRGSKKLTEGKVQLIGRKTFNLNYSAVTQNSNSANMEVNVESRALGTQGAYSYTHVDIPLFAGFEFNEEGYIHIIATVEADNVFESGFDRLELNVTPLDQYRPDMLEDKKDVLYEIETGMQRAYNEVDFEKIIGFKRKYSEYFKLPNIIGGDMTNNNYYQAMHMDDMLIFEPIIVETQKTFQFFETDRNYYIDTDEEVYLTKKPWKSYADLLINRNQAVKNKVIVAPYGNDINIDGQNQVFLIGKCNCIADLPIDSSIKDNYTTWGEH